jgi:VanZ family protein
METGPRAKSGVSPRWMWFVWAIGLVVWTYLLVAPVEWLPPWLRFGGNGISKLLTWSRIGHASAYLVLAAIVPFIPVAWRIQIALWCILSIHACATELIQTFVPTRTGSWIDVATDHVGIVTGIVMGLVLARQRKLPTVQPHQNAG